MRDDRSVTDRVCWPLFTGSACADRSRIQDSEGSCLFGRSAVPRAHQAGCVRLHQRAKGCGPSRGRDGARTIAAAFDLRGPRTSSGRSNFMSVLSLVPIDHRSWADATLALGNTARRCSKRSSRAGIASRCDRSTCVRCPGRGRCLIIRVSANGQRIAGARWTCFAARSPASRLGCSTPSSAAGRLSRRRNDGCPTATIAGSSPCPGRGVVSGPFGQQRSDYTTFCLAVRPGFRLVLARTSGVIGTERVASKPCAESAASSRLEGLPGRSWNLACSTA